MENLDQSVQSIINVMGADSTSNSRNGSRSESTFQRRPEMSLIYWSAIRIIMFGISEDKELLETREVVDNVFSCAARKSVQVHDVFWLGTR